MSPSRSPICAVYILASPSRSLYVGATSDLERCIFEHKTKHFTDSHSAKYGIDRVVWWHPCEDWSEAHAQELKLKNLHRERKVSLISESNPRWQDLSYALFGWSSSRFEQVAN